MTFGIERKGTNDFAVFLDNDGIGICIEADDADFDEAYEAAIGDAELTLGALSDSYINIKTDAGSIKIPADKAELLKTRTIDGRDYLLIPADGLILVNGVSAVFRSDDQDNDM